MKSGVGAGSLPFALDDDGTLTVALRLALGELEAPGSSGLSFFFASRSFFHCGILESVLGSSTVLGAFLCTGEDDDFFLSISCLFHSGRDSADDLGGVGERDDREMV